MNEKLVALETLRAQIAAQETDTWFYPEYDEVKGWIGTGDTVFIGLNPSRGLFPSRFDRLFYAALWWAGFQDSHITDAFKGRGTASEMKERYRDSDFMERHRAYLYEELRVLQPALVVPMGGEVIKTLRTWGVSFIEPGLPHYSQRFPTGLWRDQFAGRLWELAKTYQLSR